MVHISLKTYLKKSLQSPQEQDVNFACAILDKPVYYS